MSDTSYPPEPVELGSEWGSDWWRTSFMSTKRYCDICSEEITDTQPYRQYELIIGGMQTLITVNYSAITTELDVVGVPTLTQIDVCFQCIKKAVQDGR